MHALAALARDVAASPRCRDCWYTLTLTLTLALTLTLTLTRYTQQLVRSINAYRCASYVPQLPAKQHAAWSAAAAALAPMFPRFGANDSAARPGARGGGRGGRAAAGGKGSG